MSNYQERWEQLQKALNHSVSIAKVTPPAEPSEPEAMPHPDHMAKVQYGTRNIPGALDHHESKSTPQSKMGFLQHGGKSYVVRHGGAAHRTDVEHQMAKLLGADHMVPEQHYDHGINHPGHHGQDTFRPSEHAGTSFQEHSKGKNLNDDTLAEGSKESDKLRDQWKNGDLHKLWALHYISNNSDMHSNNFNVGKDGVKAYDSDHAFYELPTAHIVQHYGDDKHELMYMPHAQDQLPAYLSPFIDRDNDEDIKPTFKDDQVHVNSLNDYANNINPDLFEEFGPHAADRARKVKRALSSANPTEEMQKLWDDHEDKTGDLLLDQNQEKKAA